MMMRGTHGNEADAGNRAREVKRGIGMRLPKTRFGICLCHMPTAKRKKAVPKTVGRPVIARVFRNGRSDAVRIPAAMRLDCKEVEMTRTEDGGILIRPKQEISMKEFWARLDEARKLLPDDFMLDREQPPMPEDGPSPFDS